LRGARGPLKIAHRLHGIMKVSRVKKCEKIRDFLIILLKFAPFFALFRSISPRFHRFNRQVAFRVDSAQNFPADARAKCSVKKII
jgi:hypothetical protein